MYTCHVSGDDKGYHPAPWIKGHLMEHQPSYIWYWMREGPYKVPSSCKEVYFRGLLSKSVSGWSNCLPWNWRTFKVTPKPLKSPYNFFRIFFKGSCGFKQDLWLLWKRQHLKSDEIHSPLLWCFLLQSYNFCFRISCFASLGWPSHDNPLSPNLNHQLV